MNKILIQNLNSKQFLIFASIIHEIYEKIQLSYNGFYMQINYFFCLPQLILLHYKNVGI